MTVTFLVTVCVCVWPTLSIRNIGSTYRQKTQDKYGDFRHYAEQVTPIKLCDGVLAGASRRMLPEGKHLKRFLFVSSLCLRWFFGPVTIGPRATQPKQSLSISRVCACFNRRALCPKNKRGCMSAEEHTAKRPFRGCDVHFFPLALGGTRHSREF